MLKANETVPIPQAPERKLLQAEVDLDLFEAVKKESKKHKLKIREVLTWGLQTFLLTTNPKAAKELGIQSQTN